MVSPTFKPFLASLLVATTVLATDESTTGIRRLGRPYQAPVIAPVDLTNSQRVRGLLRAGNIYLSLSDAISLALENNLDIELQRYNLPIAATEILRAKGGGVTRGILYSLAEAPVGVGGPASPLVTTAASGNLPAGTVATNPSELGVLNEAPLNLTLNGTIPYSSGPLIPIYDPALIGTLNWGHQSIPQTNGVTTGTSVLNTDTTNANAGYAQGFSSGTAVNVGFNNQRSSLNSMRTSYNPFTTSNLGLTVTQPLLRGFGISVNRRYIRIAENERKIADLLFRQQLITTVYGVVRLYTDLVALYEDVKVKEETLGLAEKLYSDTKAQVDEGTQAPIELTRANAQVFALRQELINSRGLQEEQEAVIKTVITRRGVGAPDIQSARVIPTDSFPVPDSDNLRSVPDLLADAAQNRPDLQQAGVQITNNELFLKGSRNGLLPQFDIVGTAQNNALAGEVNPLLGGTASPPDPQFIGGYGSALEQLAARRYPSYSIGVQLNLPLRNRIAQADVARDELQVRQSQVRFQQLQNQAQLEVEDALIALRRARSSYEAAVQTQGLQEESLKAEQAKFEVGASTSFFLIQYQSFLAQARSTVVAARSAYLKSRAALQRATGTILDENHVSMSEALTAGRR